MSLLLVKVRLPCRVCDPPPQAIANRRKAAKGASLIGAGGDRIVPPTHRFDPKADRNRGRVGRASQARQSLSRLKSSTSNLDSARRMLWLGLAGGDGRLPRFAAILRRR